MCGTAAASRRAVVVGDVMSFPGHIACDAGSRSEVVVPVLVDGEVCFFFFSLSLSGGWLLTMCLCPLLQTVAIIDVDCTEVDGFDEVDRGFLEELAGLLAGACDWDW